MKKCFLQKSHKFNILLINYLSLFCVASTLQAAEFIPLGFLPGDDKSVAVGVSDDGSIVAGWSSGNERFGNRVFRWTESTGILDLGFLPGDTTSTAREISGDGTTIVGSSGVVNMLRDAVIYTDPDGWRRLGVPGSFVDALAVSWDGSVVVGRGPSEAFRWTEQTGVVGLGDNTVSARDVSADGTVVVGDTQGEVFRWTSAAGAISLGVPYSALAGTGEPRVSADGSVIAAVGFLTSDEDMEAYRWTEQTGAVALGGGGPVTGINADGIDDIALLTSGTQYVLFGNAAWGSIGAPSVTEATAVSGDDGFIIRVPESSSFYGSSADISGDVNGDGFSDLVMGDGASGVVTKTAVIYGKDATADIDGDGSADNPFQAELSLADLDGSNGFTIIAAAENDLAGISVSAGGDLNGDSINDIVLGAAWGTPEAGTVDERVRAGQTFVVYGDAAFPSVVELSDLPEANGGDGSQGFVINGIDGNLDFDAGLHDASGASVYAGGDFNGDGIDDLAISAPVASNAQGQLWAGEAYVLFGKSTSFPATVELSELDEGSGVTLQGLDEGDSFGRHVVLEDINGDSLADLVATAPGGDPGGRIDAGETYVIYGSPDVPVGGYIDVAAIAAGDGSAGFVINGIDAGDESGGVNANTGRSGLGLSIGDFNGEAFVDLAIGTDDGEEAYVLFGGEDILPPPPAPSFSIDDVEIAEGDSGTVNATFTVVRAGDSSGTDTVDFATADDTATTADNDYVAASGTLTFDPGVTSLPVTLTIVGDTSNEGDEAFLVNLTNPSAGASIDDAVGVGTILNDDAPLEANVMYVWDIQDTLQSRQRGKKFTDYRIVVDIRQDSDADGVAEITDEAIAGVAVAVELRDAGGNLIGTYSGLTNDQGLFESEWIKDLTPGDYRAEVTDLALAGFAWDPFDLLDATDNDEDEDGNGRPDELFTIV